MREMLGDAAPLGRINVGRHHVCYLFESKTGRRTRTGNFPPQQSRIIAVIWAKDAEHAIPRHLSMPVNLDSGIIDMFGFSIPTERESDGISFLLDRELVYITFGGSSTDGIKKLLMDLIPR